MPRVAVVNDDTVFLEMMAAVLAEKGCETAIYRESDKAFDELKRNVPDLIILDIRMERPEAGWTLLELLKLDRQTTTIPVIVCSAAMLDLRAHQDWLNAHGVDVLPKPFDITDLYERVDRGLAAPGSSQT